MPNRVFRLIMISALFSSAGCAAYTVPGKVANFHAMGMTPAERNQHTDPSIGELLEKKPLAAFPATVAIVRVQDSRYQNPAVQTYGTGCYCVVLTRNVEKPELLAKIASLPLLAGLEPINRLELPEDFTGDQQLRAAAASVHADMVLNYTFDVKQYAAPVKSAT